LRKSAQVGSAPRKAAAGIHLHLHLPSEEKQAQARYEPRGVQRTNETEAMHPKCPYCDRQGRLFLRTQAGSVLAMPCPHQIALIEALEKERGLRRAA
jgi:hypothetical protein